jgi:hypothetical protein
MVLYFSEFVAFSLLFLSAVLCPFLHGMTYGGGR